MFDYPLLSRECGHKTPARVMRAVERVCRDWETSMSNVIQRHQTLETMLADCAQFSDMIGQLEKWVVRLLEACDRQDMGHDIPSVEENIENAKVWARE